MPYTIKEVSEMLGIPTSTLRYYDRMGLLPSVEREKPAIGFSQKRVYGRFV